MCSFDFQHGIGSAVCGRKFSRINRHHIRSNLQSSSQMMGWTVFLPMKQGDIVVGSGLD